MWRCDVFALIINFATANENLSVISSIYHLEHKVSIIRNPEPVQLCRLVNDNTMKKRGCTNLGLLMLNYQINWIVTPVICIESTEGESVSIDRGEKGG